MRNLIFALAVTLSAACVADDYACLRARFENPPQEAKLRAWFHWLGDYVTEEGLRADLDAMKRIDLGGFTIVCASMYSPATNNAPVMGDEWKRLVKIAADEARAAGMDVAMHNCPGWTSSGGPWIKPENAMKCVVASHVDVADAEGEIKLPRPPAKRDFYRDVRTVAFPVDAPLVPKRATASFACDVGAVLRGEADVPIKAWPQDGECSFTFEFAEPCSPRALSVTFNERVHVCMGATLHSSADGKAFTKVCDVGYRFYYNESRPQTTMLVGLKPARFFKVTFRDVKRDVWFKPPEKAYSLRGISFDSLPAFSGEPGSKYAYAPRPESVHATVPAIARESIVDLTRSLAADGMLALPRKLAGNWRILRIGYTLTGRGNSPARLTGLECDKLSPKGIDNHWKGHVEKLLALDGAPGELFIDSYEVGSQTWTEGLDAEFARRRGYGLAPFLPALAGYAVGSHAATDRFLFDFSRTVAELMAENYYGRFAAKCRAAGVRSSVEPYFGPFDGFAAGRDFDVTVGEFWINLPKQLVRTATSLAHLYGKRFVAAESFSSYRDDGRWLLTPRQLKEYTDAAWIWGVNRVTVHSYVHQPDLGRVPGVSLGFFGSHFNRNVPWWNESAAWSRYVARGQALLTAGHALADVLVLRDECNADGVPDVADLDAAGHHYDYVGADAFAELSARGGETVFPRAPHGYKLTQLLGRRAHWTLRTLARVKALLDGGATVAAMPPLESPSLADDDARVDELRRAIWGDAKEGDVRAVGKGRLVVTDSPLRALKALGIAAPFSAPAPLVATVRQVGGVRVWFVSNPSADAVRATAQFADGGCDGAELWDAADGSVCRATSCRVAPGRTAVELDLPPNGSAFVVFRKGESNLPARQEPKGEATLVAGPWKVKFDGVAAPQGEFVFPKLVSWPERDEAEIKCFSGRATYSAKFDCGAAGGRTWLCLGDVRDAARVRVNGKEAGVAWTPPFRVELTGLVKPGENALEIEVANNWPNRLIGDARARKVKGKTWTWTNYADAWSADDEFVPAGLLGPVRLVGE